MYSWNNILLQKLLYDKLLTVLVYYYTLYPLQIYMIYTCVYMYMYISYSYISVPSGVLLLTGIKWNQHMEK